MKKFQVLLLAGLVSGVVSIPTMAAVSSATNTVKGHAPTLLKGLITSDDKNGDKLVDVGDVVHLASGMGWKFDDSDKDTATPFTYRWLVDGTQVGTNETYTIQKSDLGKSIDVEVTPHTDPGITDPADGTPVTASKPIIIAAGDEVISVAISGGSGSSGAPLVDDTLKATPTCTSACGSTVKYKWQIEDGVGSGSYKDIPGATTDTYKPTKDDQKKKLQVIATK